MKTLFFACFLILLGGCSLVQNTRRPNLAAAVPPLSPAYLLLADTGLEKALTLSEITVFLLPQGFDSYYACLRQENHRKAEVEEAQRLIIGVRWAPNLPHTGWLEVRHIGGGLSYLRSLPYGQGLVQGVAINPSVERLDNGNLVKLLTPLPPMPNNPCRAFLP